MPLIQSSSLFDKLGMTDFGFVGKGAGGEEAGDLGAAAFREQHAEVVKAVGDVIADALEARFLEQYNAVAGARQVGKEGADTEGVGAGEDAEIARAAPDGIARAEDVVMDGFAEEAGAAVVESADAMADPAIEEGRADGDESARSRVGRVLEDLPDEDAAHAVADDVEDIPVGFPDEFLQGARVVVEAAEHGVIVELARPVAELPEAVAEEGHFPSVDDRAVDEDDGGPGGRFPFGI